ncbi:MAG: hypothetical protein HZA63_08325 [Rhodocyclales bacterium]|nr:hypothetical protein [Rhodocyclales bacterium]
MPIVLSRRWSAVAFIAIALTACRDNGPVVPAATIKHVMTTVTDPAAKQIFEAAAEPPRNEAGWKNVHDNAEATAESARRLVRAVRGGNRVVWAEFSNALADAASNASAAASAKDAKALAVASDAIFTTCEGCHKVFQTPRVN